MYSIPREDQEVVNSVRTLSIQYCLHHLPRRIPAITRCVEQQLSSSTSCSRARSTSVRSSVDYHVLLTQIVHTVEISIVLIVICSPAIPMILHHHIPHPPRVVLSQGISDVFCMSLSGGAEIAVSKIFPGAHREVGRKAV